MNKPKANVSVNKDVIANTSRTDRINNKHKQNIANQNGQNNCSDSPKLHQSERSIEQNQFTQGIKFISLNPAENTENIKIEKDDRLNKTGDKFYYHKKENSFNPPQTNQLFERTPKVEFQQKMKSIRISHHYPSKSFSKSSIPSSRVDSCPKSVYNNKKCESSREDSIVIQPWIERQRSESNQMQNRRKLIDGKDMLKSLPNKIKDCAPAKIDNHVTKFSFATKAGRSVRNPRK